LRSGVFVMAALRGGTAGPCAPRPRSSPASR
jgi:hypothetical protein